jgi:hypothetical protein
MNRPEHKRAYPFFGTATGLAAALFLLRCRNVYLAQVNSDRAKQIATVVREQAEAQQRQEAAFLEHLEARLCSDQVTLIWELWAGREAMVACRPKDDSTKTL